MLIYGLYRSSSLLRAVLGVRTGLRFQEGCNSICLFFYYLLIHLFPRDQEPCTFKPFQLKPSAARGFEKVCQRRGWRIYVVADFCVEMDSNWRIFLSTAPFLTAMVFPSICTELGGDKHCAARNHRGYGRREASQTSSVADGVTCPVRESRL